MRGRHDDSVPLTYEDSRIWDFVDIGDTELSDVSLQADRRDADLMLAAQQMVTVLAVRERAYPDRKIHLRGVPMGWERHSVEMCQFPFDARR